MDILSTVSLESNSKIKINFDGGDCYYSRGGETNRIITVSTVVCMSESQCFFAHSDKNLNKYHYYIDIIIVIWYNNIVTRRCGNVIYY